MMDALPDSNMLKNINLLEKFIFRVIFLLLIALILLSLQACNHVSDGEPTKSSYSEEAPDSTQSLNLNNTEDNPQSYITSIHEIQGIVPAPDPNFPTPYPSSGDGADDSPLVGSIVTVEGVVVGVDDKAGQSLSGRVYHTDRGIYIQEELADQDQNPNTSEGIFIQFKSSTDSVKDYPIGTVLRVTGEVAEHFELTVIKPSEIVAVGRTQLPEPVIIENDTVSRDYYESLEGMLVTLKKGVASSGGTNKFGELFVNVGDSNNLSIRGSKLPIIGIVDDAGASNPKLPRRPSKTSSTLILADMFDIIENVTGTMSYSFDNYKIVLQPASAGFEKPTVTSSQEVLYPYNLEDNVVLVENHLRIASVNAENLLPVGTIYDGAKIDTDEYNQKVTRVANSIKLIHKPDIISIQEVYDLENLKDVALSLGNYSYHLHEGNDNRGIDVGFLVSTKLEVLDVQQHGKDFPNPTNQSCSDVKGLLFDRPPLALKAKYQDFILVVINVHFSSKAAHDDCRNAQADFVAELAKSILDTNKNVVVAGDLNAFEDEKALTTIENAGLENLWYKAPKGEAYSIAFSGALQTLEHILVSKDISERVVDFRYPHISTHYYDRAILAEYDKIEFLDGHSQSDHDPALVTIALN